MRIAIIGRTEILFESTLKLLDSGHSVPLIVTSKEAVEYRKTARDFENLAADIKAIFFNTAQINNYQIIQTVKKLDLIDIAISINYVNVISQSVIDLFRFGILNAHGGDLPRYRGNACQAWAIINGEKEIGSCIHKMIGGELDSGDIIVRDYLPINIDTKIGHVYKWMNERTPLMFLEAISKLEEDPGYILETQSDNPKDALRCYPRISEDGRISWQDSNEKILRLINASSAPFAGAFCEYDGGKVIIWDAEMYKDKENFLAVSGQVSQINADGSIIVICGGGKLKINEIEVNGLKMKPNQIIKSIRKRLR